MSVLQKIQENKKATAVVIVLGVILIISIISSSSSGVQPYSGTNQVSNNQSNPQQNQDAKTQEAVSKVNKIEGQTISKIQDNKVILSNGSEIQLEPNTRIDCQVDDKIIDYDDTKNSLVCQSPKQEIRYQTVPVYQSSGSGFLTNLLLWDYITNRSWMRNNRSDYYYNQRPNTYNYDYSKPTPTATNTTINPAPATNKTDTNDAKGKTKSVNTGSTKSTTGHGGGFGTSTTGVS
jgi:hypothetical protein